MPEQLVLYSLLVLGIAAGCFVSASAGLGGSLVLVPLLTIALGAKEGIAMAALLLATNNLVKLWVYRQTLPLKAAALITGCTVVGAFLGARVLVAAPDDVVRTAVLIMLPVAFLSEGWGGVRRPSLAAPLAGLAGLTSGFSGASGPLKGVAIRSLGLDRLHTVGAAALVSVTADLTKSAVFGSAGLVGATHLQLAMLSLPVMALATVAGRRFTCMLGEDGYARLFWLVISCYALRLIAA